ncbi:hypothetical protein ACPA9J_34035 [Pseudomonas aeruginosa]
MEVHGVGKVIRAEVPLGEMFGYATDVRSMSQGARELLHGILQIRRSSVEHRRSAG